MTKYPNTRRSLQGHKLKPEDLSALGLSCCVLPSVLGASAAGHSFAFISPGSSEFLLVMLVLILLFGAKDAPRIFRALHTMLDKIQRTAASFRYRIMYGDLYQDAGTSSEEPYDVEEEKRSSKQAADGRQQVTGAGSQAPGRDEPEDRAGTETDESVLDPGNQDVEGGNPVAGNSAPEKRNS